MSIPKKTSVKIGYSSFVDDLDEEYDSCSDEVVVAAAASTTTSLTSPSSPVISARVISIGGTSGFNSPVQRASPVVTGARVITPGAMRSRPLAASAPVNLVTPTVISARVISAPTAAVGQLAVVSARVIQR
jgi:hypothetical protein